MGGIVINSSSDRYKYMSIRQLEDITSELKEQLEKYMLEFIDEVTELIAEGDATQIY